MGEAFEPGAYTISGLGTITSAIYAAGGVRKAGSLRNIELKRNGVVVRKLDLYDLLIHGNTADDAKLLQGDVVLIPPVGSTVAVDGEVRRPAIYELRSETMPAEVIALAGGLTPDADTSKATLTRIQPNGERVVLPLDLTAGGSAQGLRNGDLIHVPQLRPTLDAAVELQGHVYTGGAYFYRPGMRLTDVIHSVDDLQPNADLHYVLIRRELPPDRHIEAISANIAAAFAAPGSPADVTLMPRDQITVFDLSSSRDRIVHPILEDLRMEATAQQPEQVVTVEGRVNVPGQYPLEPGMTVADLIRAGGGLADAAYAGKAELTRYVVVNGSDAPHGYHGHRCRQRADWQLHGQREARPVRCPERQGSLAMDEPGKHHAEGRGALPGDLHHPTGRDTEIRRSSAPAASLNLPSPRAPCSPGRSSRSREQQQMDLLASRMKIELGVLALRAVATAQGGNVGNSESALVVGRSLLSQLQGEKAVGRLVINLPGIVREPAGSSYDVVLRDGDELIVPRFEQEVTVIGEVQDATSHLYNPSLSRDDYIAAERRLHVAGGPEEGLCRPGRRQRGRERNGSRWFSRGGNVEIQPGDTIVVPINATQMLPLPFWEAMTGIIYNVAIAVAAIHGL